MTRRAGIAVSEWIYRPENDRPTVTFLGIVAALGFGILAAAHRLSHHD